MEWRLMDWGGWRSYAQGSDISSSLTLRHSEYAWVAEYKPLKICKVICASELMPAEKAAEVAERLVRQEIEWIKRDLPEIFESVAEKGEK